MRTALVVNVYDLGNWGDTAIAEGLVDLLREVGYERIIIAPVDWKDRPAGRTAAEADAIVRPLVSLRDVPPLLRRVKPATLAWVVARILRAYAGGLGDPAYRPYRDCDLVVSVGGGFLGGAKAGANLVKVANLRAGVLAGAPTVLGPASVNPCSGNVGRTLRWGLRGVVAYGRDQPSSHRLRALGLDGRFAPDLALRAPTLLAAHRATDVERPRRGVIGWAPRSYRAEHGAWGDPHGAEAVTLAAIRRVLADGTTRLRLIPHVRAAADDDQAAVERVLARMTPEERLLVDVEPGAETLERAVRRYADVDVLVTSRMHASLFALAVGTPALAVGYEPKVVDIYESLELGDRVVVPSGAQSPDDLAARLLALASADERQRTRVAFERARAGFDELAAVLGSAARA